MEKKTFYATDISILTSVYQMIMKFECKIPPNPICDDPNTPITLIESTDIILSPPHFKKMQLVMKGVIDNYESQYGVIKLPEEEPKTTK